MEVDIFERIKKLTEHRGIPNNRLAEAIGMSEQNYYRMIREKSIKLSVLKKILNFLRISESDFFSDDFSMKLDGKQVVNEPIPNVYQTSALIEKDLKMMETLINSIRETLKTKF